MRHAIIQPDGWPKPVGYSNGIRAKGMVLQVGGQVGWDETGTFRTDDFVLAGAFLGIRAAAPAMAGSGGGSIVSISSNSAFSGRCDPAYTASKWGLRA